MNRSFGAHQTIRATRTKTPSTTLPSSSISLFAQVNGASDSNNNNNNNPQESPPSAAQAKRWYFATPVTPNNENQPQPSQQDKGDDPTTSPSSRPFRLVFLGTPQVAATTLQTLHEASVASQQPESSTTPSFEIVGVVTQPAKRRRKKVEPTPVAKVAESLNLPLYTPEKLSKDADFLTSSLPNKLQPDLCVTAAYGQYLPKKFLATPRLGTVNIHPSLLPQWRGASPVQRSLQAGDNPVGVSVLYTVSKMDAGPIVAQQAQSIDDDTDTTTTVLPRLFALGTQLLLQALPGIWTGQMTQDTAQVQDEAHVTAAPLIRHVNQPNQSEGDLDLAVLTARQGLNLWRGLLEWPGVHVWIQVTPAQSNEEEDASTSTTSTTASKPLILKVKIIQARVVSEGSNPQEGDSTTENDRVLRLGPHKKRDGLYATCHDGSILELVQVQPPTKRPFPARDLQNGYPNQVLSWLRPQEAADLLAPAANADESKKDDEEDGTNATNNKKKKNS